jgi:filamentous hemagglutinin family protein
MKKVINLSVCFTLAFSFTVSAQIITDGTTGTVAAHTLLPTTVGGKSFEIPQNLGTVAGANLFHSFNTFDINNGETATFTSVDSFQNVISRVTGNNPSTIDGALVSKIGQANFYFINPAGVTFGANASIDVPAAFHVSTANSLKFANNLEFNASNANPVSTLMVANPESFGFLGSTNGKIEFKAGSSLTAKAGQTLDLVTGNITLDNNNLWAESGEIRLVTMQGQGLVSAAKNAKGILELPSIKPTANNGGNITVQNNSYIKTEGNGGGRVAIWGGDVTMKEMAVLADNNGETDATEQQGINIQTNSLKLDNASITANVDDKSSGNSGNVTVNASQFIDMKDGGFIGTSNYFTGQSGDTTVSTNTLNIDQGGTTSSPQTGIFSVNWDKGIGGKITVNAKNLSIVNGGTISSATWGDGKGGEITVTADTLKIDNKDNGSDQATGIVSDTWVGAGKGGAIAVNAKSIEIVNGGKISAFARITSAGKAGSVTINDTTAGSITLANNSSITIENNGIVATPDIATNPDEVFVKVQATDLTLDNSFITAATSGNVDAGNVEVTTQNPLIMSNKAAITSSTSGSGKAGDVKVSATHLSLDNAEISALADTTSTGKAGKVIINETTHGSVSLVNNSRITVQNNGTATDLAKASIGDLDVQATDLTLDNSSLTAATTGNVKAGDVSVNSPKISLSNNAEISALADTTSTGKAGSVTINDKMTGSINLANNSRITVQNNGTAIDPETASIGDLDVHATDLTLDNSSLTAATSGNVKAGDVKVNTPKLSLTNNAEISALADVTSTGNAGNVTINDATAGSINLANNSRITVQNNGTAIDPKTAFTGDLDVQATDLTLDNSSLTAATTGNVKAGDVTVNSPKISLSNNAEISALADTSSTGNAGNVSINKTTAGSINLVNSRITVQNNGTATAPKTASIGDLDVHATDLTLDNSSLTAATTGNVNAGLVTVHADNALMEKNNAAISSSTSGAGAAGTVGVSAPLITIDNAEISAAAKKGSSGKTGDVTVTVSKNLSLANQSKITIQNDATVANPTAIEAGEIRISAPDINLKNSSITAESSQNVDAGHIKLNFSGSLMMDPSYISTAANSGNGGDITINGGNLIYLQNSGFKTSVADAKGNGGNINVTAHTLIMDNGVIQANAVGGRGGDINLNLNTLIPTQNSLIIGGVKVDWLPFQSGLNIIQAASQNGVSGNINVTSPKFNISGSLTGLNSIFVVPTLENNPCLSTVAYTSSLARHGKGGVATNETQTVFVPALAVPIEQAQEQKVIPSHTVTLSENDACTSL